MRACASLIRATQFMMYDKDQGGSIDMDECMEIFFRRFGKLNLEVCKYGANTPTPQIPHCEQLLSSSALCDPTDPRP